MQLRLRRKFSRSGRTLVLRIPKDIEEQLHLNEATEVFIWIENNKIVIEPIKNKQKGH
jgi:antitoxin component of MazEF toxin-antitoxin module